ncbi:hypothetical protein HQ520_01815, partial [bacterium]|nr:hypothetical protein [bacterium]
MSARFPSILSFLILLFVAATALPVFAQSLATIEIDYVSPRKIAESDSDTYDEVSSGLRVVGLGQKVYVKSVAAEDAEISGYTWALTAQPGGSSTSLSASSGGVVTLIPDVEGDYVVSLTPLDGDGLPTLSDMIQIHASTWVGAGVMVEGSTPRAPECGTGFCHGGNNANPVLNVKADWMKSKHFSKLENHMNGERGGHYDVSCLPCHTVGFDASASAVNDGFDDIANMLGYDLAQIPALVADAVANDTDNYPLLPDPLKE